jgi:hypothetical protein
MGMKETNPTEVKAMKKKTAEKELQYQFCSICFGQFHYQSQIVPHYKAHEAEKKFRAQMPQNGD